MKDCYKIVVFFLITFFTFITNSFGQLANCIPQIQGISINGNAVSFNGSTTVYLNSLNNSFTVRLWGSNNGSGVSPANYNNLTMSFPQFNSSVDKSQISLNGSTGSDVIVTKYFGSEAGGCDAYADYVMVEGADNNGWLSSEINNIYLDVKAKVAGDFIIRFRMGLGRDASWNNFVYDPAAGCNIGSSNADCSGFESYKITVKIILIGNLDVTVQDLSGNVRSGAEVLRYDSNWVYIDKKTTGADGRATWPGIPIGRYNLESYYNSNLAPFTLKEYWAGSSATINPNQTTYLTLKRNEPYTSNVVFKNNSTNAVIDQSTPIPPGTTVRAEITVTNNTAASKSVRVTLVMDRNKDSNYDTTVVSSSQTISLNGGTKTFPLVFTPRDTGIYYRGIKTETRYSSWQVTDTYRWDSAIRCQVPIGNLEVTVQDLNGNIKSDAEVLRYNSSWGYIDKKITDSYGKVRWDNIPLDTYHLEAYYNSNLAPFTLKEYWVGSSATVSPNQTTYLTLKRNEPYTSNVVFKNNSTNAIIDQSTPIPLGTTVRAEITDSNKTAASKLVRVTLVIDRNKDSNYDTTVVSSSQTISANGRYTFQLVFTPRDTGIYYRGIKTETQYSNWQVTDTYRWDPVIRCQVPIGNLDVTVQDLSGNVRSGAEVLRYDSNWVYIDKKTTGADGRATWSGIPIGRYNLESYYNSNLAPFTLKEYWAGSSATINPNQTTYLTLKRNEPYTSNVVFKNNSTNAVIDQSTPIPPGTTVRAEITDSNKTAASKLVRVTLVMDRNKDSNYDTTVVSSTQTISGNGRYTFQLVFTPRDTGIYYRGIKTETQYSDWQVTDTYQWDPVIRVVITQDIVSLYGDVVASKNIVLFNNDYKMFTFCKLGAPPNESIVLPFKTINNTPLLENFITSPELVGALYSKYFIQSITHTEYGNWLNLKNNILTPAQHYFDLDRWWIDDNTYVPAFGSKRKVDRVMVGDFCFSAANEVLKLKLTGGASLLPLLWSVLNTMSSEGKLYGVNYNEIQSLILAQASYNGKLSTFQNMQTLIPNYSKFETIKAIGEGIENTQDVVEIYTILKQAEDAAKVGNNTVFLDKLNQLDASLATLFSGILYDNAVDLITNVTGLEDLHEATKIYAWLSDVHYDAISTVKYDAVKIVDSIISLENSVYSPSNCFMLKKYYNELCYKHSILNYGLEAELEATQLRRLSHIKNKFPIGAWWLLGGNSSRINELKENYNIISYPTFLEQREAYKEFIKNVQISIAGYQGALKSLNDLNSNNNLLLIYDQEQGKCSLGQENTIYVRIVNQYDLPITINSFNIAGISPGLSYTYSSQAIDLNANNSINYTFDVLVPDNWLSNNYFEENDNIIQTKVNLGWLYNGKNYEKEFILKHVVESSVKIDSIVPTKNVVFSGDNIILKIYHSGVTDYTNLYNANSILKPNGTRANINIANVSNNPILIPYTVPNGPYGAYGNQTFLKRSPGNLLSTFCYTNKLFYVIPKFDGNIDGFGWNNCVVIYPNADSLAAFDLKQILKLDDGKIYKVEDFSVTQLQDIANQNNTILIGGHLANPLVALLGQTNLTKEGDAIIKFYDPAFGNKQAIVIAGWLLRDTEIATMGFLKQCKDGNIIDDVKDRNIEMPNTFQLSQNYPNPFNPSTIIKYGLPNEALVTLTIYNTLGQRVALLVDEKQEAGYHEVTFDGSGLTSGVYFYRIQSNNYVETKKLLLMK